VVISTNIGQGSSDNTDSNHGDPDSAASSQPRIVSILQPLFLCCCCLKEVGLLQAAPNIVCTWFVALLLVKHQQEGGKSCVMSVSACAVLQVSWVPNMLLLRLCICAACCVELLLNASQCCLLLHIFAVG
jgi:hypothetical protein